MKKIYKYRLGVSGMTTRIDLKVEQFLHIESQDGIPTLWALIDDDIAETAEIYCYGTGWPISEHDNYIGTAIDGYGYVWHYFV